MGVTALLFITITIRCAMVISSWLLHSFSTSSYFLEFLVQLNMHTRTCLRVLTQTRAKICITYLIIHIHTCGKLARVCSHLKTGGSSHPEEGKSTSADRLSGSTLGRLSSNPPPVMCAMPYERERRRGGVEEQQCQLMWCESSHLRLPLLPSSSIQHICQTWQLEGLQCGDRHVSLLSNAVHVQPASNSAALTTQHHVCDYFLSDATFLSH